MALMFVFCIAVTGWRTTLQATVTIMMSLVLTRQQHRWAGKCVWCCVAAVISFLVAFQPLQVPFRPGFAAERVVR